MKSNIKKTFIISVVPALTAVLALGVCGCSPSKTKLDITCRNCSVEGVTYIQKECINGESVSFTIKPDAGFILPDDIDIATLGNKLVKGTDYTYSKETGETKLTINASTTVIALTSDMKSLKDCSWGEISEISKKGKANEHFKVGDTKDVMINSINQPVRIIGLNQDEDKDGNKLGITFEFMNILSDSNGYSIASYWNDTGDSTSANNNYKNSTIRAVLNGEGGAFINYFQKGSKNFSNTYKDKSVLSMLPDDLRNALATPSKFINVKNGSSWSETTINDKLFLLSPKELGYADQSEVQEQSTFTYKYYEGHTAVDDFFRNKRQIKGYESAIHGPTSGNDLAGSYTGTKFSYAGYDYHDEDQDIYGGSIWLRSPRTNVGGLAWHLDNRGTLTGDNAYSAAHGVAPAFCI